MALSEPQSPRDRRAGAPSNGVHVGEPEDPTAVPLDGRLVSVIDDFAKAYLHSDLREVRGTMLWKLEGLSEYDSRRPLTGTGTNLLGLIKHLTITEARYFGAVFGRPFPEHLPRWDDDADVGADMWATADESRAEIIDRYRRAWEHADATIAALDVAAPGHVPWWPRPDVKLFNVMVHVLTETNRHAGHADILREQLDGAVGTAAGNAGIGELGADFWEAHRGEVERAARAADQVARSGKQASSTRRENRRGHS